MDRPAESYRALDSTRWSQTQTRASLCPRPPGLQNECIRGQFPLCPRASKPHITQLQSRTVSLSSSLTEEEPEPLGVGQTRAGFRPCPRFQSVSADPLHSPGSPPSTLGVHSHGAGQTRGSLTLPPSGVFLDQIGRALMPKSPEAQQTCLGNSLNPS